MKGTLTILAVIAYVLSINLYMCYFGLIEIHYSKLWYNYTLGFAIGYYAFNNYIGITNYWQQEFNRILIAALLINQFLVILVFHGILDLNFKRYFYIFNGSTFVVSMLILFSGVRHGIFKLQTYKDAN